MDDKHTPGPWGICRCSSRELHILAPNGGQIAAVGGVDDDLWAGDETNARLIATAPTLLEALRALLMDTYGAEENEDGERVCAICQRPDYLDCNPDESCGRARAAINLATTGEES